MFVNIHGATQCESCPSRGVDCEGGVAVIEPKFWLHPDDNDNLTGATLLYPCFHEEACSVEGDTTVVCNQSMGYKRNGILCGECNASTHVRSRGKCIPCAAGEIKIAAKAITAAIFCVVMTLAVLWFITRPASLNDHMVGSIGSLVQTALETDGARKSFKRLLMSKVDDDKERGATGDPGPDGRNLSFVQRSSRLAKKAGGYAANKAKNRIVDDVTGRVENAVNEFATQGIAADDAAIFEGAQENNAVLEEMKAAAENVASPIIAKVKIIIGYAQITSFVNDVFSIEWPPAFVGMTKWLKGLNADIMGFVGTMTCQVHVRSFAESFLWHMSLIPVFYIICRIALFIAKQRSSHHSGHHADGKNSHWSDKLLKFKKLRSEGKYTSTSAETRMYKVLSFLIFLLYPGICVKLFRWVKCTWVKARQNIE